MRIHVYTHTYIDSKREKDGEKGRWNLSRFLPQSNRTFCRLDPSFMLRNKIERNGKKCRRNETRGKNKDRNKCENMTNHTQKKKTSIRLRL